MTALHKLLSLDKPTAANVSEARKLAGRKFEKRLLAMEARREHAHPTPAEKAEADVGDQEMLEAMRSPSLD